MAIIVTCGQGKIRWERFRHLLSDLYGSGFVINGDAIRAKAGKCTIKSRRHDGDSTVLGVSCATTIMTSDLRFRYKVIDDNTLRRDFPDIEGRR